MWRVVGVRVGLPRLDMEVEGVVVKDDAVLELQDDLQVTLGTNINTKEYSREEPDSGF